MATIIDSLIVTLGLNNGQYIKAFGQSVDAQKKFRDQTKKTGNEVSDALAGVGKAAAGLFLGFESVKGALGFFAGLTVQTANLGRFAKNVGEGAHELNAWDNAAELAGGSAADAEGDIRNLSQSITNLKATGSVSDLLLLMMRLGVATKNADGSTRKLTDIYKDAGDKLRQFNRADAANLAKSAGISDTTLNLIIAQADERERLLRAGEANAAVDARAVQNAQDLQEAWRGIGQEVKAAGTHILTDFAGPVKEAFSWVQKLFASASQSKLLQQAFAIIGGLIHSVVDVAKLAFNGLELVFKSKPAQWIEKVVGKLLGLTGNLQTSLNDSLDDAVKRAQDANAAKPEAPRVDDRKGIIQRGDSTADLKAKLAAAEKEYGIPEGVLKNIAQTESHFRPDIISGQTKSRTGATGLMQLEPKYFPDAGKDTGKDIDTAAAYLKRLYVQFGDWTKAVAAYNDGPGNINKVLAGTKNLPDETSKYIDSVLGPNAAALATAKFVNTQTPSAASTGGSSSTNSTEVQIDSITVQTQATDADGIAAELPGAIKRKGVVAQADQGMT